jgi:hypothetical protein
MQVSATWLAMPVMSIGLLCTVNQLKLFHVLVFVVKVQTVLSADCLVCVCADEVLDHRWRHSSIQSESVPVWQSLLVAPGYLVRALLEPCPFKFPAGFSPMLLS